MAKKTTKTTKTTKPKAVDTYSLTSKSKLIKHILNDERYKDAVDKEIDSMLEWCYDADPNHKGSYPFHLAFKSVCDVLNNVNNVHGLNDPWTLASILVNNTASHDFMSSIIWGDMGQDIGNVITEITGVDSLNGSEYPALMEALYYRYVSRFFSLHVISNIHESAKETFLKLFAVKSWKDDFVKCVETETKDATFEIYESEGV